jgi:hypothetical protein
MVDFVGTIFAKCRSTSDIGSSKQKKQRSRKKKGSLRKHFRSTENTGFGLVRSKEDGCSCKFYYCTW